VSTYLATIPVLLAAAGAIAALTARRLRTETALAAGEIMALALLADAATQVRSDAAAVATRAHAMHVAATPPGAVPDRARR
jgi:hypothetical protein